MSSGILAASEVNALWTKFQGSGHEFRAVSFRLSESRNDIVIDDEDFQIPSDRSRCPLEETAEVFEKIKARLNDGAKSDLNLPRWIVINVEFKYANGGIQTDKNVLIKWMPSTCKPKDRMCYASSTKGFQDNLTPKWCGAVVQADDIDDINDIIKNLEDKKLIG